MKYRFSFRVYHENRNHNESRLFVFEANGEPFPVYQCGPESSNRIELPDSWFYSEMEIDSEKRSSYVVCWCDHIPDLSLINAHVIPDHLHYCLEKDNELEFDGFWLKDSDWEELMSHAESCFTQNGWEVSQICRH